MGENDFLLYEAFNGDLRESIASSVTDGFGYQS
jgi:hypothetical protein